MPTTPNTKSTTMSPSLVSTISGVGAGISAVASAYTQGISYDIQEMQAKTAAKRAEVQGKADALQLLKQYNKIQASNAVMSVAQGRSGGSVDAIASASKSQLDWDMDFTRISSEIQAYGYRSQAEQYSIASETAKVGGSLLAIGNTGLSTYEKLYSIGGTTKENT